MWISVLVLILVLWLGVYYSTRGNLMIALGGSIGLSIIGFFVSISLIPDSAGLGGIGALFIYLAMYGFILLVGMTISLSGYFWQRRKKK